MQNWKIKRMSNWRIKEWLRAIEKLLDHYVGKRKLGSCGSCPLCMIQDCDKCLWQIIERKDCTGLVDELYPSHNFSLVNVREDFRYKKWRTTRLAQLKNWKKILKAELARRDL